MISNSYLYRKESHDYNLYYVLDCRGTARRAMGTVSNMHQRTPGTALVGTPETAERRPNPLLAAESSERTGADIVTIPRVGRGRLAGEWTGETGTVYLLFDLVDTPGRIGRKKSEWLGLAA